MDFLKDRLSQKKALVPILTVAVFFCLYILLGNFVVKDYGVSLDESRDNTRGRLAYARLMGGSAASFNEACSHLENSCEYPSFFSIVTYALSPSGSDRAILLRKHKMTFAFFALSIFVFFLIGRKLFKDWKIGLLGALFLIISPRIFAQSFYNPKDIPFLSAYVIAAFTLLLFLEKKNIFTALLHGLAVGVACGIRTPGLILLPISALFYLFDLLLAREKLKAYLKAALFFLALVAAAAAIVYIFSPTLYGNPIGGYIESFKLMKQYPWNNYHLYMGQNITNQIPWHYSLVWFAISSPIFYVLLFLLGFVILAVKFIQTRHIAQFQSLRSLYVIAALGILPILAVIVEKSVIYTDNRQMYFVYPALLLVSLFGFVSLAQKLRSLTRYWQVGLVLVLAAGLASPVYFMLRYHPYEGVYFNSLAGPSMSAIKEKFPLDNWALSGKQALEYILKTDPSGNINISYFDTPPISFLILPAAQLQRLHFSSTDNAQNSPDYILTNYRNYPAERVTQAQVLPPMQEYYSIQVGDAAIYTVYKVIHK